MLCLWAAKGGAGCSVTAASLAVLSARYRSTLLVDLGGDGSAICGVDEPRLGLKDWLGAEDPPPDALARLEVPVVERLSLLALGAGDDAGEVSVDDRSERLAVFSQWLAADSRVVVVDCGSDSRLFGPVVQASDYSLLVTRACYLSLRTAASGFVLHGGKPDGVIVVREAGRSLDKSDIAYAVGAPVVATVGWSAKIARSVDAGILCTRPPKALRPLEALIAF